MTSGISWHLADRLAHRQLNGLQICKGEMIPEVISAALEFPPVLTLIRLPGHPSH